MKEQLGHSFLTVVRPVDALRAILASDADGACHAMRDHVTRVGLQAIENFSNQRFAAVAEPVALGERSFG